MSSPLVAVRPARDGDLDRVLDQYEQLMNNGTAADPRFRMSPGGRTLMDRWGRENWLLSTPFPPSG